MKKNTHVLSMVHKNPFQSRIIPRIRHGERRQQLTKLGSQEIAVLTINEFDMNAQRTKGLFAMPPCLINDLNNPLNVVPICSISIFVGFETALYRGLAIHDLISEFSLLPLSALAGLL